MHKFVDEKKKKNGNQKIEMKFNLEGMENMGKGENLSISSKATTNSNPNS